MSCFGFFKSKSRNSQDRRSAPTPRAVSGPASTSEISRSDDSAAGKPTSKSSVSTSSQRSIPTMFEERASNLRVFEFNELRNATNDFSRMTKIGEGGFGSVYKGYIKPVDGKGDRIPVAVKKLNQSGLQGHKQWLAEVQFLGVVEHPNLVKLIGYCSVDGERGIQRLLVYEFMPNKALDDHLFNKAYPSLPWNSRLKIVLGIAEGLTYLHEGLEVQVITMPLLLNFECGLESKEGRGCFTTAHGGGYHGCMLIVVAQTISMRSAWRSLASWTRQIRPFLRCLLQLLFQAHIQWFLLLMFMLTMTSFFVHSLLMLQLKVQVIYRDFKAANVLLDQDFKPKLSDFGLAREGPTDGRTHVSTAVVGTYGYAAPDYIETGHLTVKSDVWSFGVVLYEILTGRRSLERSRPKDEQKLLEWVKHYPADSRKFSMIIDPRLRNNFSLRAAREIAKLADCCLSKNAKERPAMSEVVQGLKKAIQLTETGDRRAT